MSAPHHFDTWQVLESTVARIPPGGRRPRSRSAGGLISYPASWAVVCGHGPYSAVRLQLEALLSGTAVKRSCCSAGLEGRHPLRLRCPGLHVSWRCTRWLLEGPLDLTVEINRVEHNGLHDLGSRGGPCWEDLDGSPAVGIFSINLVNRGPSKLVPTCQGDCHKFRSKTPDSAWQRLRRAAATMASLPVSDPCSSRNMSPTRRQFAGVDQMFYPLNVLPVRVPTDVPYIADSSASLAEPAASQHGRNDRLSYRVNDPVLWYERFELAVDENRRSPGSLGTYKSVYHADGMLTGADNWCWTPGTSWRPSRDDLGDLVHGEEGRMRCLPPYSLTCRNSADSGPHWSAVGHLGWPVHGLILRTSDLDGQDGEGSICAARRPPAVVRSDASRGPMGGACTSCGPPLVPSPVA